MKEHVAIVIRDDENKILFIRRALNKKTLPGAWSFPSGTIEINEKPFNTAIREANEELGIDIRVEKLIAKKELKEFGVNLYFILCKIQKGNPLILQPEEISEIKWMSFNEFFNKYSDNEIGHGLIFLRRNPELLNFESNINLL